VCITYKKCLTTVMFVFLCLGIARGLAHGTLIPLDAKADAGLYPGQGAFLSFVDGQGNPLLNVSPTDHPEFTSSADVYAYAYATGISDWMLQSAGNIWSSDLIVGESLMDLPAGTYRVSVPDGVSNAYEYDSFGWSDYKEQWSWGLYIRADKAYKYGQIVDSFYDMLGSTTPYSSADLAFQAVQGSYIDITLAEGGSLNFWIWDWDSIDNSGGISFNVTSVPEPSTFMLLTIGLLPSLLWRVRG
jgi:hypothetical protein